MIATPNCPDVSYDLVADEVVTHDALLEDVVWWEPETLQPALELAITGPYADFVAFDHKTVFARVDRIDHYDETGTLVGGVVDGYFRGLHVHYDAAMLRLFFSGNDDPTAGPDAHAVGSWQLGVPPP